jgi:hypothetical protein
MLYKKGESKALIGILVVLVLGMLGFGAYAIFGTPKTQQTGLGGTGATPTAPTVGVSGCPDTYKSVYFKVFDDDASSITTTTNTIYIYDKAGNFVANTTGSATDWSTAVSQCGDFHAVALTKAGQTGFAEADFSLRDQNKYVEMHTNNLTYLQARVKYRDTDAYAYLGAGNSFATNDSTAYVNVNSTLVATDTAETAKAIGADGVLKFRLYLQSSSARKYFGDKKLKTVQCYDLGTNNVWDTPTVSKVGTGILTDVKGNSAYITSNDAKYSYISNSEFCYDLGTPIPYSELAIDVDVPARSGQNPGSSDDVLIYTLPQGVFASSNPATPYKQLTGIVTDASTQALVGTSTAYVPLITVEVS